MLFVGLFTVGIAVLLAVILWIVTDAQRVALTHDNDEDIDSIIVGFRQEGIDEASEVVRQLLGEPRRAGVRPTTYLQIKDAEGHDLVGNLPGLEHRLGEFSVLVDDEGRVARSSPTGAARIGVLGKGVALDPRYYVFVGRDTANLTAARNRIVDAFLWILAGAVIVACVGGTLLAQRLTRRVDLIARTCEGIVEGRFDARIPIQGRGHEWDRLSRAINEMLSRISALLANLQQVSSDVAHDLRTPLTRMRNRLEEARSRSVTSAEYSSAVSRAIEDTDELLAMFSSLLRISQVEAGTRLAGFAAIKITELLRKAYEIYRPVAEDHGQRLVADLEQDLVIAGDAELLLQMFSNLIENAIGHTPKGSLIRMTLKTQGGTVTAAVVDNGPGIPAGEIDKVTRRFYRLSRSRSEPGHGLGLALVAATAQLHGATLKLGDAKPGLRVEIAFHRHADL
jgi:signal transduction histidine kinase